MSERRTLCFLIDQTSSLLRTSEESLDTMLYSRAHAMDEMPVAVRDVPRVLVKRARRS